MRRARGLILVLAVGGTGCLAAPPDSKVGRDGAPASPCDGPPPETCTYFRCDGSESCYLSCIDETTWSNAMLVCGDGGRKVLETETIDELDCAQAYNAQELWIGLIQDPNSIQVDEGWVWLSDGLPPVTELWGLGEPNDNLPPEDHEEECAAIVLATGTWRDVPCDTTTASIVCEIAPE